jgi:hypothetical protein
LVCWFEVDAIGVCWADLSSDPTVALGDSFEIEGGSRSPQKVLEVEWGRGDSSDAVDALVVDNVESLLMLVDGPAVFLEIS